MLQSRSVNFALFPGILSAVALAQTGSIMGTVTDPDGGVVEDALIQSKNTASSAVVRGTGSPKGEYSIEFPPRTYDLVVVLPCCQHNQPGVRVGARESRRLDIRLWRGPDLGTLADDPILLLNEFRERAAVHLYREQPRRDPLSR